MFGTLVTRMVELTAHEDPVVTVLLHVLHVRAGG